MIGGPPAQVFWITLAFQNAHLLSPFALAWGHDGFRQQVALRHPWKFVALPAALLGGCVAIGVWQGGSIRIDPSLISWHPNLQEAGTPLGRLLLAYILWNAWHFGRQNYGVMSLLRRQSPAGNRTVDQSFCLGCQAAMFVIALSDGFGWALTPVVLVLTIVSAGLMLLFERLSLRSAFIAVQALGVLTFAVAAPYSMLWGFLIWQMGHWLIALALAGRVWAAHRGQSPGWFCGLMVAAGMLLFWALFGHGLVAWAVGARIGISFAHFLYDRWLYRFSDPMVRMTIGKDLFASA